MNDEAVYRTAPATPGLLKSREFSVFAQYKEVFKQNRLLFQDCLQWEILRTFKSRHHCMAAKDRRKLKQNQISQVFFLEKATNKYVEFSLRKFKSLHFTKFKY